MSKQLKGAVTYPKGFLASGVRAGIKQQGADMALIASEVPAVAAGVFTTNVIKAAPVVLCSSRVPRQTAKAVIVNSGNANACTGEQGMADAREMASETAKLLGVSEEDVFVASTGVIGHAMPMDNIRAGIADAVASLSAEGGSDAALAIMTTDTFPKQVIAEVSIGGKTIRIGGIAKGAGMICPNVATMLSFITTDAAITPEMLQLALLRSAEVSYNCLTIDGDTSTNDTVILLANGWAENSIIDIEGPDFAAFQKALDSVTTSLARLIATDGEGATKCVTVVVEGAKSYADCRQIALTIANSPLVKTALYGNDPNWGRVLAAAGRAGINFDPLETKLYFGETLLLEAGEPVEFSAEAVSTYLSGKEVNIDLRVGNADAKATVLTCDFSYDYVKINAEYHT